MFFNIPKCKHMHMGREENNTSYVMTPNNEEIPIKKVSSEKDLGVVIDNKLLFREHISGRPDFPYLHLHGQGYVS